MTRGGRRGPRVRSSIWRAGLLLILLAVQVIAPVEARSASPGATEDEVEAVYLYNFAKFLRWPPAPAHKSIALCVVGDDRLESALERVVAGETVDGRSLESRSLSSVPQAAACDILFLGSPEDLRTPENLKALKDSPVVTVSNAPDFLRRGGIIQFVVVGGAVRFSVNLDAARRAHIGVSSQLLKVALSVFGKPQGETP